ncbi:DUF1419 domain-containing protein [Cronobacter sakazakii]|uniref:DUF1419 domain-containing protein n=1 Tax=Cronobacter sakazakii TaxID=28141 RepID=UPI001EFDB335|nr:DUF1419 domain-containing protein [Cronobacter sakazakii]
MNTQNVNTAAQESSRTIVENPFMAFVCDRQIVEWAKQKNGIWVAMKSGYNVEQMKTFLPDVELVTADEALEMQNARYRAGWKEVSEERYIDQLEVLPPMDWCRSVTGESFKSSEMYAFDVTSIFARVKGRFFECKDLCTMTHDEVMASVENAFFARNSVNSGH